MRARRSPASSSRRQPASSAASSATRRASTPSRAPCNAPACGRSRSGEDSRSGASPPQRDAAGAWIGAAQEEAAAAVELDELNGAEGAGRLADDAVAPGNESIDDRRRHRALEAKLEGRADELRIGAGVA